MLMYVCVYEQYGLTALHYATMKGHTETVRVLLSDNRIDVHLNDKVSACKYDNMQGADGVDVCMCV